MANIEGWPRPDGVSERLWGAVRALWDDMGRIEAVSESDATVAQDSDTGAYSWCGQVAKLLADRGVDREVGEVGEIARKYADEDVRLRDKLAFLEALAASGEDVPGVVPRHPCWSPAVPPVRRLWGEVRRLMALVDSGSAVAADLRARVKELEDEIRRRDDEDENMRWERNTRE